jgi:quinol-cytochrome oxidoreductase complex cytochrome b subunit
MMKLINRGLKVFQGNLLRLGSPKNLSFLWNFGSILGAVLVLQIISGVFLTLFYTNDVSSSYLRVEIIERLFIESNLSRL